MTYDYQVERLKIFTEDGVKLLTKIRGNVVRQLKISGAVMNQNATENCSGDSWTMHACLDYMIEQNEIREIKQACGRVAGQHIIYTNGTFTTEPSR